MTFSRFQDLALYHPQAGFYGARGSAGHARDFLTSPEVGSLFGQVLANAFDKWWRAIGRPNPFFIFEAAAGTGTLAATMLEADMMCASSLRYVTIERSAALRGEQAGRLPLQDLDTVLDQTAVLRGPIVAATSDLPQGEYPGVVFANELLDNLPVDLYERRGRHWYRVLVGVSREGGFEEVFEPLDSAADEKELGYVNLLAPQTHDGARFPMQRFACEWVERALGLISQGRVVTIDFMRSTQWMLNHDFSEWCRTYRSQRPGTSPLDVPGTQDITCEVAMDQISRVKSPNFNRSQADFLDEFGLADLVSDARQTWHGRAAIGDLASMKARSKVQEGRALTDENGLGRYRVLEWEV
jgi:SAM-dependent MidA family methyltransferase